MTDFDHSTAVVLHDAGAANHAIAWIDAGLLPGIRVYAEGPAARIWATRSRPPLLPSLGDALAGATGLVSGTGWQSMLEHEARVAASERGLPSHAVLDHWVNYPERFVRNGMTRLPDALLVADAEAEAIASVAFPGLPVRRLPNLYGEAEVAAVKAATSAVDDGLVLALMEPVREPWGAANAGEFIALDYLRARWHDAGFPPGGTLLVRAHPSEPEGKYEAWRQRALPFRTEISNGTTLAQDIARVRTVVGLNSYALTIALAAGRSVWSILPPEAPPCVLPHAGIRHLRSLPAVVS